MSTEFPAARYERIGATPEMIDVLREAHDALNEDEQRASAAAVASRSDADLTDTLYQQAAAGRFGDNLAADIATEVQTKADADAAYRAEADAAARAEAEAAEGGDQDAATGDGDPAQASQGAPAGAPAATGAGDGETDAQRIAREAREAEAQTAAAGGTAPA